MTSGTYSDNAERAAKSIGDSPWFEHLVRGGLVVYGVVHLLIGWLGLQLAFGDYAGAPDPQGALRQLAQQPGGEALLWATGLGLFVLALWQVTEALWGHTREDGAKRHLKRVGSAGRVVIYAVLGLSALKVATGSSSSSNEDSMTRKLLDLPAGQLIVVGVGVVIIVIAVIHLRRGLISTFDKDLDTRALAGSSGTAVKRLGQVGYIAKGVALAVLGGLFVWAGVTYDASRVGGLDTALRTLLEAPVGPWLLAVVAAGIICFGLYCFCWARYADTSS
jgi:cytochrome bd-type quinol oxidase subunit 2